MMFVRRYLIALTVALAPFAASALPAVDEIVEGYRSTIGPEQKLKEVRSLHFKGRLIPANPEIPPMEVEIYMTKPRSQLVIMRRDDQISHVGVNGYEGFTIREAADGSARRVDPLPTAEVIQLTTNAIENLNFLKYPPMVNVRSQILGTAEVLGRKAIEVRFSHRNGIEYYRYFDPETYDLVATRSQDRLTAERGSFSSDGLTFGDRLEVYADDQLIHTVEFDMIEVNPDLDPSIFAYPEE